MDHPSPSPASAGITVGISRQAETGHDQLVARAITGWTLEVELPDGAVVSVPLPAAFWPRAAIHPSQPWLKTQAQVAVTPQVARAVTLRVWPVIAPVGMYPSPGFSAAATGIHCESPRTHPQAPHGTPIHEAASASTPLASGADAPSHDPAAPRRERVRPATSPGTEPSDLARSNAHDIPASADLTTAGCDSANPNQP